MLTPQSRARLRTTAQHLAALRAALPQSDSPERFRLLADEVAEAEKMYASVVTPDVVLELLSATNVNHDVTTAQVMAVLGTFGLTCADPDRLQRAAAAATAVRQTPKKGH